MFWYLFKSWLFTLLIYPVILFLGMMLIARGDIFSDEFGFMIIMMMTFVTLLGSFGVILLSWFFLHIIIHSDTSLSTKFILWLFALGIAILLCSVVIILIVGDGFFVNSDLILAVPAAISVWIIECIRFRHFKKLDNEINHPLESLQFEEQ
jgi:hypothetical protein